MNPSHADTQGNCRPWSHGGGHHLCALGDKPATSPLPRSSGLTPGPAPGPPQTHTAEARSPFLPGPCPDSPLRAPRDAVTCLVLSRTPCLSPGSLPEGRVAQSHTGSHNQHGQQAAGAWTGSTQTAVLPTPHGQPPKAGLGPMHRTVTVVEKEPLTAAPAACQTCRDMGGRGAGASMATRTWTRGSPGG